MNSNDKAPSMNLLSGGSHVGATDLREGAGRTHGRRWHQGQFAAKRPPRKLRGWQFKVAGKAQLLFLELPEARRSIQRRERSLLSRVARALMSEGRSLNRTARFLGIAPSNLHAWLQQKSENAEPTGGKRRHRRAETSCKLTMVVRA
jgi:hypothetical protein